MDRVVMMPLYILCATGFLVVEPVHAERGQWRANGTYTYYASPENITLTFDESFSTCKLNGGELAVLKTKEIHNFISSLINNGTGQPYSFYFGYRRGQDGYFVWNDCTSDGFTFWRSGQPGTNSNESCAVVGADKVYEADLRWSSTTCDKQIGYICQKPIGNGMSTSPLATSVPCFTSPAHPTDPEEYGSAPTTEATHDDMSVLPIVIAVPGCVLLIIVITASIYVYKKRKSENTGPLQPGFDNRMYISADDLRE